MHALEYARPGPVVAVTYEVGLLVVAARYDTVVALSADRAILFGIGSGLTIGIGTLFFYRSLSAGGTTLEPAVAGLYFVVTTIYGVVALDNPSPFHGSRRPPRLSRYRLTLELTSRLRDFDAVLDDLMRGNLVGILSIVTSVAQPAPLVALRLSFFLMSEHLERVT